MGFHSFALLTIFLTGQRSKDSVESADWWVSQTYCINLFLHRAWLTTLRKYPALPESYFANSHLTNSLNRASTTLGRWLNFLLEEARHDLRSCDVHTCYCSEPTRRGFSSAEKKRSAGICGKKKKKEPGFLPVLFNDFQCYQKTQSHIYSWYKS